MAISFTPTWESKRQMIYDYAATSGKLNEEEFQKLNETNPTEADQYLSMLVSTIGKTSDTFSQSDYDMLAGSGLQSLYLYNNFLQDKTEIKTTEETNEEYNVYDTTKQYLNIQLQQIKEQKIYDDMSWFEKRMAEVGAVLGDVGNAIYGILESLIDVGILAGGAIADVFTGFTQHEAIGEATKKAISYDVTGTGAIQEQLNEFKRVYVRIDEKPVLKFIDDVAVGAAQMLPLFIPGAGSFIYGAQMAGATAREAIQKNPDIDLANLVAYTALVTGVEYGTEALSGKIFGGADLLGAKMLNTTAKAVKGKGFGAFLRYVGFNFASEAFEESLSEVIDGCLDVWLVGGKDSQYASISDVIYAGLVGGTLGAVMAGARVASTRRVAVTESGEIVNYRSLTKEQRAKARSDGRVLGRMQTIGLRESLQEARQYLTTDPIQVFYNSHSDLNLSNEELQEKFKNEYERALDENKKRIDIITDATQVLSTVLKVTGEENFARITRLAEGTLEQRAQLIREYTEYTPSTKAKIALVENAINSQSTISRVKIREDLTASQIKLQEQFSKLGIDVYYADYAEADGYVKNHNAVIDEHTVVLDIANFENASYEQAVKKVANEQLVRSLQYKSGILSKQNIKYLQKLLFDKKRFDTTRFDDAKYLQETDVEKLNDRDLQTYANAQANMLSQLVLFDEITINKLMLGSPNIFTRVYRWLKRTAQFLTGAAKKTDITTAQYNRVLKSMREYEKSVAKYPINPDYQDGILKYMGADSTVAKRVKDMTQPTAYKDAFKHWAYIGEQGIDRTRQMVEAKYELDSVSINNSFSFENSFDPNSYTEEFRNGLNRIKGDKHTFKWALQEYLISQYGLVIDDVHEQFVEVTSFAQHRNANFTKALDALYNKTMTIDEFKAQFTTLGSLFDDEFNARVYSSEKGLSFNDIKLNVVEVDRVNFGEYYGETNWESNEVTIYVDPNVKQKDLRAELSQFEHTIYHETQHLISDWTNLYQGNDPATIETVLSTPRNKRIAIELWNKISVDGWESDVAEFGEADVISQLADYIYERLAGEYLAEGMTQKTNVFANSTYFDMSIKNDRIFIRGFGSFSAFIFSAEYDSEQVAQRTKTEQERDRLAREKQLKQITGNITPEFAELQKKTKGLVNKTKELINSQGKRSGDVSGIGDEAATNAAIKALYPQNRYATNVKYVDTVLAYGLRYAEAYRTIKNSIIKDVSLDTNKPMTLDEVRQFVDAAVNSNKEAARVWKRILASSDLVADRTQILNKDYNYSVVDTKEVLRDTRVEKSVESSRTESIDETIDEGDGEIEKGIASDEDVEAEVKEEIDLSKLKDELDLSSPRTEELVVNQITSINENLNNKNAFTDIRLLERYAEQTQTNADISTEAREDGRKVQKYLDDHNLHSRENYDEQIKNLRDTLATRELSDADREVVNVDTAEFESPQEYIAYINELKGIESLSETTQPVETQGLPATREQIEKWTDRNVTVENVTDVVKQIKNEVTDSLERATAIEEVRDKYIELSRDSDTASGKVALSLDNELSNARKEVTKEAKEKIDSASEETKAKVISDTLLNELSKESEEILKILENAKIGTSEAQYVDDANKEYIMISSKMILKHPEIFMSINSENYAQIREELMKSASRAARPALVLFDYFCMENVGIFDLAVQNTIKNTYREQLSLAGGILALQRKRVEERTPVSTIIEEMNRQGLDVDVTDDMIIEVDPDGKIVDIKHADDIVSQCKKEIDRIKKEIENSDSDLEKKELLDQLKEISARKEAFESNDRSVLLDYIVSQMSLEDAAKFIRKFTWEMLTNSVELGPDQLTFKEQKSTGKTTKKSKAPEKPLSFPKVRKIVRSVLTKANQFRMWALLSSPVTWARNWVGNEGMRALDSATNAMERLMMKMPGIQKYFTEDQLKYNETRGGKELAKHIDDTYGEYILSLVRRSDARYDTTGQKYQDIQYMKLLNEYQTGNAFRKVVAGAQLATQWGLNRGFLGDEPVVIRSICKNMANLVASNPEFLLKGIQNEYDGLASRKNLSQAQSKRLTLLEKALNTQNPIDIFNAMDESAMKMFFDNATARSFEQYFKNDNKFNDIINNIAKKSPMAGLLISTVLPFPKVAANILTMAYRYSPLGFFRAFNQLSQLKQMQKEGYKGPIEGFEAAKMVRSFSEATVGTLALITGIILAAIGLIDVDDDDYLGPCLNIAGLRISLNDLAPSMTTFSIGATLMYEWKHGEVGIKKALGVLYDNTLLGNIDNIFNYASTEDFAQATSLNYISQYIPAVLKLITKTIDPAQKDKTGNFWLKAIKTLGSYIPGVSYAVPRKINPYTGEATYQSGSWWLNILNGVSPISFEFEFTNELQAEAERVGANLGSMTGAYTINDKSYTASGKIKEKLARFKSDYIQSEFDKIKSGKKLVTVQDENGKRITTSYNKLTDAQKKNVLNNLYSRASTITKIEYWTSLGNVYYETDMDKYNEYRSLVTNKSNIVYKKSWSKSKFVER